MNGINEDTNGNGHASSGLKIIIVGAGIGGLTAAIALRRQGHNVEASFHISPTFNLCTKLSKIFESSRFAKETGAAIHIPPNAYGILKCLGVKGLDIGANECNAVSDMPDGNIVLVANASSLPHTVPQARS